LIGAEQHLHPTFLTMASPTDNKNNKNKSKSKKRPAPQVGDPDYRSPTQLRNDRKRRKLKQTNQERASQSAHFSSTEDPSLRYIANPLDAPTVQKAISFFQQQQQDFEVFVGPTTGWRTVAKLAVRSQRPAKEICVIWESMSNERRDCNK
jgi:hypothetical protein